MVFLCSACRETEEGKETCAGLDEEALESSNTSFHQRKQLVSIPRNNTAVEANINPALALAGGELLVEAMKCRGGRDGVQGHVNNGRHSTRGGSPRAGVEAFPFCAAWLIEVNMCVDEAG